MKTFSLVFDQFSLEDGFHVNRKGNPFGPWRGSVIRRESIHASQMNWIAYTYLFIWKTTGFDTFL